MLDSSTSLDAERDDPSIITAATTLADSGKTLAAAAMIGVSRVLMRSIDVGAATVPVVVSVQDQKKVAELTAEIKSWLHRYRGKPLTDEYANEIATFVRYQIANDLYTYTQALKSLAFASASIVPAEALSQVLIESSDQAQLAEVFALASAVEQFLDSDSPVLVDAAAKALSLSRLSYSHAVSRLNRTASRTDYRYLKKILSRVAAELSEKPNNALRP